MKTIEEMSIRDVLQEFVHDIEVVYGRRGDKILSLKQTVAGIRESDWPDLSETYLHAKAVLLKDARMGVDAKKPFRIKKFLSQGETDGTAKTVGQLIYEMGRLLDKSCASEIFGTIVFEGEDGLIYTATVEGSVDLAHPDYVKEVLDTASENEQD